MTVDVAIIGAGIVGSAVAYELAQYDVRVLVVEQTAAPVPDGARAPWAMIRAGHHSKPGTLRAELEWEGNRRWEALADTLGVTTRRTGELVLAMNTDDLFVLGDLVRQAQERGVTGVDMWTAGRVRSAAPGVSEQVLCALYAPETCLINPIQARVALALNAQANGVRFANNRTVTGLWREDGEWIIETNQGPLRASFLVNASGSYADQIAAMAGARPFAIHTRITHEFMAPAAPVGLVKHVLIPCSCPVTHGAYIAPVDDRVLWIGPMVYEVGTGDDLGTHQPEEAQVLRWAQRLLPGLAGMIPAQPFTSVRAVAESDDMQVGASETPGLLNAAGLQASALTAAPAIAAQLARVLRNEGLELRPRTTFRSVRTAAPVD